MKKKMMKLAKKLAKRLLSGDKHIWGWVTLDLSNPFPPTAGLNTSAQ